MAALDRGRIAVRERGVTGALENDREAVHRAIELDPPTAAALTLEVAREITEELIRANEEYPPEPR